MISTKPPHCSHRFVCEVPEAVKSLSSWKMLPNSLGALGLFKKEKQLENTLHNTLNTFSNEQDY